ncbi:MAG: ubiquinol-cytochrome c reductase iron-sulfur subunit [Ignavibacteria bacterium]|nr:ubiquinol-cytochrome c reductase iron-sulfur subunit [Ignavibacteria bacterium]
MNKETANTGSSASGEIGRPDRRTFLQKLGVAGALAGFSGFTFQFFRSLIPNVLYEPSRRFKVGYPDHLAEGMTFLDEKRLYLFREGKSYYAISGSCTHLGCTVRYSKFQKPIERELDGEMVQIPFEFQCPCHGSRFYADGTNYEGPAPEPLRWYKLELAPDDGQLVVNLEDEVDRYFRLTV